MCQKSSVICHGDAFAQLLTFLPVAQSLRLCTHLRCEALILLPPLGGDDFYIRRQNSLKPGGL